MYADTVADARAEVAPCAGAWIEMLRWKARREPKTMSLPVRERGLKS